MKVLHVIPSLSPARGGPSIVVREMVAALASRGVTVHVATTDDDGPRARLAADCPEGIADSGGLCFYFPRQTRFYSFSWPLTHWLSRHIADYDLVHIHALFSYPSVAAAALARRRRVPYLLRPLGTLAPWGLRSRRSFLKRWSLALIEKPMLRRAAAVQATSEMERGEVLAACPDCRVVVIPNPVAMPDGFRANPGQLPEKHADGGRATILFLSRIDPKKGLELLLAAFDRLAPDTLAPDTRDLYLVIAGDGDPVYVASIRRLASSLGSRDRIEFTGHVGGERKRLLFARADLFVLPSHAENFGVAVVEAMAHAVPVLISPHVGIAREVAEAGAGDIVHCATDPELFARGIAEMLKDPDGLRRMGERARRLALERYSPDPVARLLLAEYRAVLAGGGKVA